MNKTENTLPKRRLGAYRPMEECLGCGRPDTFGVHMRPSMKEIQGEEIAYETEKFFCTACEAEWMSPTQADIGFKKAVTLFLTKHGMLTAADCEQRRKKLCLTQQDLVEASGVSIATIKRLESGVHILTKAHNDATERALETGEHNLSMKQAAMVIWTVRQCGWQGMEYFEEPIAVHSVEAQFLDTESSHGIVDQPELLCA